MAPTREEQVDYAIRIEVGVYAQHLLDGVDPVRSAASVEELTWLAADGKAAIGEFAERNVGLVHSVAASYIRNGGMPPEDVVSDGVVGVLKAIQKFDYTKGWAFSTYAVWWIRQSIGRGQQSARVVHRPHHILVATSKVLRVRNELEASLGRVPTIEEIGARADMTAEKVADLLNVHQEALSLDLVVGEALALTPPIDQAADQAYADVENRALFAGLPHLFAQAGLSPYEQEVLLLRHGVSHQIVAEVTGCATATAATPQQIDKGWTYADIDAHLGRGGAVRVYPRALAKVETYLAVTSALSQAG